MLPELLSVAGLALAPLLLLTLAMLAITWRARRRERARRDLQLDSVFNSRMRRERGD